MLVERKKRRLNLREMEIELVSVIKAIRGIETKMIIRLKLDGHEDGSLDS